MALFFETPLAFFINLDGSSPPSPELLFPPILFIAIAKFSCASLLIEPYDIAPVLNLLTISVQGSTSSIGIGSWLTNLNIPLRVINCLFCLFIKSEYTL